MSDQDRTDALQLEISRVQRIRDTLGGDEELDTEHLAKAVVQELADAKAQRDTYKRVMENLNVEMEVLRGDNEILATKLQDTKELLDDAEKRPWWSDRPDETEIVGKVLRLCGVYDDVSDAGFNRAALLVKGYFADQFPLHLRPDYPLKEGWNAG